MAFFDKLFGRRKATGAKKAAANPKPMQKRMGHRGIAAGDVRPGKQDLSAENVAKWKVLGGDDVEEFVHLSQPLFVHSTCVTMAQYFADSQTMLIEYLPSRQTGEGAGAYKYGNVSEEWAYEFAQAQSKGAWVWDRLRIRGSKFGHRVPYEKIW